MTAAHRAIRLAGMLVLLIVVTGCATSDLRLVQEELDRPYTDIRKESGQSIEGYLLHDGTREHFRGRVRLVEPDSLAFWVEAKEEALGSDPGSDLLGEEEAYRKTRTVLERGPTFPIEAVKALDIYESRAGGSVALVTVSLVAVLVAAFYISLSSGFD